MIFCILAFVNHFVYILHSPSYDKYYKGYSTNPDKRLIQHNDGESRYTKNFAPWELVHLEQFDFKSDALKREKVIKKYSKEQIRRLINTPKNVIHRI